MALIPQNLFNMKNLINLLWISIVFIGCQPKQSLTTESTQLESLLKAYQDFVNEQYPEDGLSSLSEVAEQRRFGFYDSLLKVVRKFPTEGMAATDRYTVELMAYTLKEEVDEFTYHMHENSLLADGGFHIGLAYIPGSHPFTNVKDYENYLSKLEQVGRYMDENIALLRNGIKNGWVQPEIIFDGYEQTYEGHIVDNVEESIYYKPFANFPVSLSETQKKELEEKGRRVVSEVVVPAYRRTKEFFENEYFPACRSSIGASELPDGKAFYQNRIEYYTTLPLTADSIHALGLSEVARIKNEMMDIIQEVHFKGSFSEFLTFLRTDPQFYAKTPEDLLKEAAYVAKTMDGKLPALFGRLPRLPYTVEKVPDYIAPKYTGGRYIDPPEGGKVPGKYWVNTYDLKSRPLYVLNSLTLHEAVPGHHLNIALTMELEHLPEFRKTLYLSAFGEGWGLYSEYLGLEAGMYKDPYRNFGRLTYEMWRACRLVVDTGIHAFGWTRQQALDYMAENTALSIHEITTEVDRYIAWPGQALSYKIGELKIKALRKKAEKALVEKFDIRQFHDVILSEGSVTLPILEEMVDDYIKETLNKPTSE